MAPPIRHGHRTRYKSSYLYALWRRIKQCCYDENYQAYCDYGSRGIRVCDRWRNSFDAFVTDVLSEIGPKPSRAYTFDRIKNDDDYRPGNIRWSTMTEQIRNRRTTKKLIMNGITRTVAEWSEISGVPGRVIRDRIKDGWDNQRAITQPTKSMKLGRQYRADTR